MSSNSLKRVGQTFLVAVLSILTLAIWLTIHNIMERAEMDRLRTAIEKASYPGQGYNQYKATLYKKFPFEHVTDWEKAVKMPNGRSVGAVTGYIGWTLDWRFGPLNYDILVTADFDHDKTLRSAVVKRRGHGF